MKPIELKKASNYLEMPPVGAYVAEVKNARIVEANGNQRYDRLELMTEIIEGDYKGRFGQIFEDQKERGYDARWKGIFRLSLPTEGQDNSKVEQWVSNQIYCVVYDGVSREYRWDGDPKSLIGKKVGINMRKKIYNYTNKDGELVDGETTEIGRLETVDDVKAGKCKVMRDRDTRQNRDSSATDSQGFTDVSKTTVDVPW